MPLLLGATVACGGEGGFDAWCNAPGQETSILFLALASGAIATRSSRPGPGVAVAISPAGTALEIDHGIDEAA